VDEGPQFIGVPVLRSPGAPAKIAVEDALVGRPPSFACVSHSSSRASRKRRNKTQAKCSTYSSTPPQLSSRRRMWQAARCRCEGLSCLFVVQVGNSIAG